MNRYQPVYYNIIGEHSFGHLHFDKDNAIAEAYSGLQAGLDWAIDNEIPDDTQYCAVVDSNGEEVKVIRKTDWYKNNIETRGEQ